MKYILIATRKLIDWLVSLHLFSLHITVKIADRAADKAIEAADNAAKVVAAAQRMAKDAELAAQAANDASYKAYTAAKNEGQSYRPAFNPV